MIIRNNIQTLPHTANKKERKEGKGKEEKNERK